ncbi:MAG: hypothetical protein IPK48_07860 [Gammaproteobacteria bacterium]|nr:hypothetical protein [Gammaproteobacteria bacterium]
MDSEKLREMTLSDAENAISKSVYAATRMVEELEYAGRIRGNGHHLRQEISEFAVKLMRERWED